MYKMNHFEKYGWEQSFQLLTIYVPLNDPSVRAKDIRVIFYHDALFISVRRKIIIEGKIERAIYPDDCLWFLDYDQAEDRKILTIALSKVREDSWNKCFVEEDKQSDGIVGIPITEVPEKLRQQADRMQWEMEHGIQGEDSQVNLDVLNN